MDDFGFYEFEASSDDFNSGSTEPNAFDFYKAHEGLINFKRHFEDNLASEVFRSKIPPISFLHEYTDHEDTYEDPTTYKFIKWYAEKNNQLISRIFVACALEERHERRENNGKPLQLGRYVDQFNEQGMRMVDTDYQCDTPIPQYAGPRVSRIYNVWYRRNNPADGANLFATRMLGKDRHCSVCGSIVGRDGTIQFGRHYLELTGNPQDD